VPDLPVADDGELICAAMSYLTIALMQEARPDAHLIVRTAPVFGGYYWPAGWSWEPAPTSRENLLKARDLVDAQLAEPDQLPASTHGYPRQSDVAAWNEATGATLHERTMDLLRECGALRTALLNRQDGSHDGSHFAEWTLRVGWALGDVFLNLLDLAEMAGFDLETAAALRWRQITTPTPPKDVVADEATT
jgi:hypothetical protein